MRALAIMLVGLVVAPYWPGGDVWASAVRATHAHEAAQPVLAEIDPRSDPWVTCVDANTDSDADSGWSTQVRTAVVAVDRVPAGLPPFERSQVDLRPRAPRGPPLG